jgi:diguanylate cyclase (GGDEF)-like protein
MFLERLDEQRLPGTVLGLLLVDLDRFKQINDHCGHLIGDQVLRAIAEEVQNAASPCDLPCRLGGDEFAILLPGADIAAARKAIRDVRRALMATMTRRGWPVTFSIGVVTFLSPPAEPDEVIRITDSLMYEVKASGKNHVLHRIFDRHSGLADATAA